MDGWIGGWAGGITVGWENGRAVDRWCQYVEELVRERRGDTCTDRTVQI